jgi:hypothetical protein
MAAFLLIPTRSFDRARSAATQKSTALRTSPEQVLIHGNWQAAGLKASSSCDYSIENVFVPDAMTFSLMEAVLGKLVSGGAALRVGVPAVLTPSLWGSPWASPGMPWTK